MHGEITQVQCAVKKQKQQQSNSDNVITPRTWRRTTKCKDFSSSEMPKKTLEEILRCKGHELLTIRVCFWSFVTAGNLTFSLLLCRNWIPTWLAFMDSMMQEYMNLHCYLYMVISCDLSNMFLESGCGIMLALKKWIC